MSTMTHLKIVVNRAMAYTDASRKDALTALVFSSGQVTIMALIIIGCVIFAIVLLIAVLVVRRRDTYTKVRGNGDGGHLVVTPLPPSTGRKPSLTIANVNSHSLHLTQV